MRMRWVYNPFIDNHWKRSDIENFNKLPDDSPGHPLYIKEIEKFIQENLDLKDAINSNDWDKVFDRWDTVSETYIAEVLSFFLQEICHIDFVNYLSNPLIYSVWQANYQLVGD